MGFKGGQKNKKAKESKAKNKSKSKGEWAFDGGADIIPGAQGKTTKEKGPRRTQEKEEKLRRGRLTLLRRKNEMDFKKKMSKKIQFADLLAAESKDEEKRKASELDKKDKPIAKKIPQPPRPPSERSIVDRLRGFISGSVRGKDDDDIENDDYGDENEGDDDGEEEEVEDEEELKGERDLESSTGKNEKKRKKFLLEEEEGDEYDEEEEEGGDNDSDKDFDEDNDNIEDDEDDDDDNGNALVDTNYEWFFNNSSKGSNNSLMADSGAKLGDVGKKSAGKSKKDDKNTAKIQASEERKPLSKLSSFETFDIYGSLDDNVKIHSVKKIGDIPGLHKMWRSRKDQSIENEFAKYLLPYLECYADMMLEGRDVHCNDEMLQTLLLHACTHVVRCRSKVIRHNQKLKKRAAEAKILAESTSAGASAKKKKKGKNDPDEKLAAAATVEATSIQDQGFTRPRVLILCPLRSSAKDCIDVLKGILGSKSNMSNLEKFEEEFGPPESDDDDEDDEDEDDDDDDDDDEEDGDEGGKKTGKQKKKKSGAERQKLPEDWEAIFKGNMDDDFKFGVQINPGQGKGTGADKGAYVRLFSDFFQSDIIIASPLGLKLTVEGSKGKLNFDFLSSIEMVILHQADVMYMQNWDHVDYILKHTNRLPEDNHDTDFSRVRPYFLDGEGALHRQLLITTNFIEPCLHSSFREFGRSIAGTVRLRKDWKDGCITQVKSKVRQVFQLVPSPSFDQDEDARFKFFVDNVLTQILRLEQAHTLICTPSYMSYVCVRNELIRREANAAFICEHSRESEISRGRSRFFHGQKDILLYSGRCHFFRRFKLRGSLHLVFYSLPEYAHFYPEIVNLLGEAKNTGASVSCLVLFTKYERMALERIVGADRCAHILTSGKQTFMFQ